MGRWIKTVKYWVNRSIPNRYFLNYLFHVPAFLGRGKFPRAVEDPDAGLNDHIFHFMIGPRTAGYFLKACVDKQYGKWVAAGLCRGLKVPRTLEVIDLASVGGPGGLRRRLGKFAGKHCVAKPTNGSGTVLFLKKPWVGAEVDRLFDAAQRGYFHHHREGQYLGLEKKVIVEEGIPSRGALNDYKFFCSRGKAYFCQVDFDRFVGHQRSLFSVPGFKRIHGSYGHPEHLGEVKKPVHWRKMCATARRLSRPFDFVRVDLYDNGKDVFFGEYTFSPGASLDEFSDEGFSVKVMREIKKRMKG